MKKQERRYRVTLTEAQLRIIADCVEDCHRFAAGQMELHHTTCFSGKYREMSEELGKLQKYMTPELARGASYDWAGNHCPNEYQRKFIARTYAIYREIIHKLTEDKGIYNAYSSPTLTCEDGGEPPIIEKL